MSKTNCTGIYENPAPCVWLIYTPAWEIGGEKEWFKDAWTALGLRSSSCCLLLPHKKVEVPPKGIKVRPANTGPSRMTARCVAALISMLPCLFISLFYGTVVPCPPQDPINFDVNTPQQDRIPRSRLSKYCQSFAFSPFFLLYLNLIVPIFRLSTAVEFCWTKITECLSLLEGLEHKTPEWTLFLSHLRNIHRARVAR